MKKRSLLALGLVTTGVALGSVSSAKADIQTDVVNEKWGKPTLVYGAGLNDEQVAQVNQALGVKNTNNIVRQVADSNAMAKYLNIQNFDSSNMFSSVLVQKKDKGNGVVVQIKTPQNITSVTATQYANAAITAGVSDVELDVAAPFQVTGESALSGVYVALSANGTKVDTTRTQVAQNELNTVQSIANAQAGNAQFSSTDLDKAVLEIKKELYEANKNKQEPNQTTINNIVINQVKEQGLEGVLTDEQIQQIVDLALAYNSTSAVDSKATLGQLDKLEDNVDTMSDGVSNAVDSAKETVSSAVNSDKVKETTEQAKEKAKSLFDTIKGWFGKN